MLCYVDRSKSLSSIDHNFLHLYNLSHVHLFDHARRMCGLYVVNLLRFLNNSFLVIFVRSKYILLSQISSTNLDNDVSSYLNLNRCLNLTTTNLLQPLIKSLECSFLSLEIHQPHKWENDRLILYFDFY